MSGITDEAAQRGHDIIHDADVNQRTGITDEAAKDGHEFIQKAEQANLPKDQQRDDGEHKESLLHKVKDALHIKK